MDKIEQWASREADRVGVTSPHMVKGFKEGVRAAYEAVAQLKARKRMAFVPGGDPQDIWSELLK